MFILINHAIRIIVLVIVPVSQLNIEEIKFVIIDLLIFKSSTTWFLTTTIVSLACKDRTPSPSNSNPIRYSFNLSSFPHTISTPINKAINSSSTTAKVIVFWLRNQNRILLHHQLNPKGTQTKKIKTITLQTPQQSPPWKIKSLTSPTTNVDHLPKTTPTPSVQKNQFLRTKT